MLLFFLMPIMCYVQIEHLAFNICIYRLDLTEKENQKEKNEFGHVQ